MAKRMQRTAAIVTPPAGLSSYHSRARCKRTNFMREIVPLLGFLRSERKADFDVTDMVFPINVKFVQGLCCCGG